MTSHTRDQPGHHEPPPAVSGTHALLLVLALILLVAGFPFFVFGSFLAAIGEQAAIDGGRYFAVGGLVAMACAWGLKGYLRRRDGWF